MSVVDLGITVLGSGSKGNSVLLHTKEKGLLVDIGFSRKEMLARLETRNISPDIIQALVVTHEHDDHVKGCRVFTDQFKIPSYLTPDTYSFLNAKNKVGNQKKLFDPGSKFDIDQFYVEPFAVQHDAIQPVGFVITINGFKVGIATDLGFLNRLCMQRLYDCDALVLESNHDIPMLRMSERPLSLKRRIMSRHGHLNNEDAINSLDSLLTSKTKYLCLAHISSDCNDHDLVENMAVHKLNELGRQDIKLDVAKQSRPMETTWF